MTRFLARLADVAYRRRGRMVLAWIAAAVVIIGVGSALAGEYNANYDTPGSESKAASDLTQERFAGYSGQEIYVVWKDRAGADSAAAKQRIGAFIADARKVDHIAPATPVRISENGQIGATTLPLTIDGWDVPKEDGEKLIAAAERHSGDGLEIKLGGDPIYAAQDSTSPEGLGFLGAAIVLLIAFGSPLISLKAAIMNLLSVSAAYGVMTLAAKGGGFSELIGIDHEVPIAPFMPVMMFAILFGLSMDYEVFLISRIREEYLKDGDTRRAVADGLAKTARVITAAAAIMVVVFLAFLAAPDVFLKLFGIGLATAIFLDATVVRMVLVPAVMQLLGDRNWWIPNWLERILPRLDVERVAVGAEGRP